MQVKFIYSEKATKFCEISTLDLSYVVTVKEGCKRELGLSAAIKSNGQIYGEDFTKFCGLLRIYELY